MDWTAVVGRAIELLIASFWVLLILCGIGFLAIGSAGGVLYQNYFTIADVWGRIVMWATGAGLIGLGIWIAPKHCDCEIPDPKEYGFKITSPMPLTVLPSTTKFEGTYLKKPPKGYEVRMMRGFPRTEDLYPLGKVLLKQDMTWEAVCDIGSKPGEHRFMWVCLVGPAGQVLMNYFKQAADAHNPLVRDMTNPAWLPNLKVTTEDVVKCDRVEVIIGCMARQSG